MNNELRLSYKKEGYWWRATLKDAKGNAVWSCEHLHKNRDQSTKTSGRSAWDCARVELDRRKLSPSGGKVKN